MQKQCLRILLNKIPSITTKNCKTSYLRYSLLVKYTTREFLKYKKRYLLKWAITTVDGLKDKSEILVCILVHSYYFSRNNVERCRLLTKKEVPDG